MGGTIEEFFYRCDEDYLVDNLSASTKQYVTDESGLHAFMLKHIVKERRALDLNKDEARELFTQVNDRQPHEVSGNEDLLSDVIGDEWWYALPEVENHEYTYLCKIIKAVKEGIEAPKESE